MIISLAKTATQLRDEIVEVLKWELKRARHDRANCRKGQKGALQAIVYTYEYQLDYWTHAVVDDAQHADATKQPEK